MKKLKYHYIIITGLLFCLCQKVTLAQGSSQSTTSDSSIIKLAEHLSISQERAQQIQAAYNYHYEGIKRLVMDESVKPDMRQQRLKQMLSERQQKVDTVVTPTEKARLASADSALIARMQTKIEAINQRHQQQLNRLPHTLGNSASSVPVNQQ